MNKIVQWIDERISLEAARKFAKKKEVPVFYGTVWYYLGGVALFLFIIQIITGILLTFYYQPGVNTAYESVKFIVSKVEYGWLIRETHSWSANLFIFFIFLHMFTVFFAKAYRKPREMTWMTGMLLLLVALGFGFSGYLLPWNELSFFATRVGTEIAGALPVVGDFLLKFLRAGDEVSGATLTRFYGIHVAVLPLIAITLLVIHLLLVQFQGMSVPPKLEKNPALRRGAIPFFPNFVLRDLTVWLIVFNVVALLALLFPWELGLKADPLAPAPAGIRPEWYFMFMFQTLKQIPAHFLFMEGELFGILVFLVGGIIWFLVPFLDKHAGDPDAVSSKRWTRIGIIVLAFIIVMTIWGYLV
ncbi:MAG: cytochrome bc complex cytochrome b subunit [Candidatus Neomarinimicrobiota bacterium]|nr:MAG: cytochrome bc complex cytochrome b subunit [Candidatus Neomarinimicrobiota bacterium]